MKNVALINVNENYLIRFRNILNSCYKNYISFFGDKYKDKIKNNLKKTKYFICHIPNEKEFDTIKLHAIEFSQKQINELFCQNNNLKYCEDAVEIAGNLIKMVDENFKENYKTNNEIRERFVENISKLFLGIDYSKLCLILSIDERDLIFFLNKIKEFSSNYYDYNLFLQTLNFPEATREKFINIELLERFFGENDNLFQIADDFDNLLFLNSYVSPQQNNIEKIERIYYLLFNKNLPYSQILKDENFIDTVSNLIETKDYYLNELEDIQQSTTRQLIEEKFEPYKENFLKNHDENEYYWIIQYSYRLLLQDNGNAVTWCPKDFNTDAAFCFTPDNLDDKNLTFVHEFMHLASHNMRDVGFAGLCKSGDNEDPENLQFVNETLTQFFTHLIINLKNTAENMSALYDPMLYFLENFYEKHLEFLKEVYITSDQEKLFANFGKGNIIELEKTLQDSQKVVSKILKYLRIGQQADEVKEFIEKIDNIIENMENFNKNTSKIEKNN